jgi:hypothetical protein
MTGGSFCEINRRRRSRRGIRENFPQSFDRSLTLDASVFCHTPASPHFSPPFSAIAPKRRTAALLYLRNAGPLHPCSRTAATLCRTLPRYERW